MRQLQAQFCSRRGFVAGLYGSALIPRPLRETNSPPPAPQLTQAAGLIELGDAGEAEPDLSLGSRLRPREVLARGCGGGRVPLSGEPIRRDQEGFLEAHAAAGPGAGQGGLNRPNEPLWPETEGVEAGVGVCVCKCCYLRNFLGSG